MRTTKRPGNVLVIDDDKSARILLERVLTKVGHKVTVVDNPSEGLAHVERTAFDILISDKNLDGTDGLDVLRKALERSPALKTILMTGFPTPETKAAAQTAGVFAYVTKPFGIAEIVAMVENALAPPAGEP